MFARFALEARLFHSGTLCQLSAFDEAGNVGYVHLLRSGRMSVSCRDGSMLRVDQPSVLYFPRPSRHCLCPDEAGGADLVCASVDLGGGLGNPLVHALPEVLVLPLHEVSALAPTLELLFAEAFGDHCGRQAALNRLIEYFLILLLRHVVDSKRLSSGVLAALGDARLARAITAMHERPEYPWSLAALAATAGMSRARFAQHFRAVAGCTPLSYLTDWRLSVAQTLLRRGKTLKALAPAVGYQSPAALTRIFSKKLGLSPSDWLSQRA